VSDFQVLIEFWNLLKIWKSYNGQGDWTGTSTELRAEMKSCSALTELEKKELPDVPWMNRRLTKISSVLPDSISSRKTTEQVTLWTIRYGIVQGKLPKIFIRKAKTIRPAFR